MSKTSTYLRNMIQRKHLIRLRRIARRREKQQAEREGEAKQQTETEGKAAMVAKARRLLDEQSQARKR